MQRVFSAAELRLRAMTSAVKLRVMARKSLENATFYHGVALPRQSCAACCQNPTYFCTAHTPVLYFPGKQRFGAPVVCPSFSTAARVFRVRKNLSKTKA